MRAECKYEFSGPLMQASQTPHTPSSTAMTFQEPSKKMIEGKEGNQKAENLKIGRYAYVFKS
jgi:hypothetical protein